MQATHTESVTIINISLEIISVIIAAIFDLSMLKRLLRIYQWAKLTRMG
jgi:hypothetical protein